MAKYIEREAVINVVANNPYNVAFKTSKTIQEIKKIPSADVVEVVRCKDCKYFEIDEEDELGECKCGCISVSYGGVLYPHRTDFCSYGERECDK